MKEFKRACKALGVYDKGMFQKYWVAMDADGDGMISKSEWESFMPAELRAAIEVRLRRKSETVPYVS